MTISLVALGERVAALAPLDGVDEHVLTGEATKEWLTRVGEVRQATDVILAKLAHHADRLSQSETLTGRFARREGYTGAAGLVANAADLGTAEAGRLVSMGAVLAAGERADAGAGLGVALGEKGDRLLGSADGGGARPAERFAYLARAVREGALGTEKVEAIRKTLQDFTVDTTEIEVSLVDRARTRSVNAVRKMCALELARSDQAALEAREARNRQARYFAFYDEADGMVGVRGRLDVATAAPLRAWLDTQVRAQMVTERELEPGHKREPGQIAADALAHMARHCLGCEDPAAGVKTTLVVRVDLADLEAGVGVAVCDGVGGPVSVSTLRAMAVDAQVIPQVMGGASLPLDVGRARRLFSPVQRLAIAERDGGCAKCGAPVARCDVHHIRWWSRGGGTDVGNGVLLCVGCHHRLHDHGWDVHVDREGLVWFIPPASVDPHRRRQPASPARLNARAA
jgi:hypothetical protein